MAAGLYYRKGSVLPMLDRKKLLVEFMESLEASTEAIRKSIKVIAETSGQHPRKRKQYKRWAKLGKIDTKTIWVVAK